MWYARYRLPDGRQVQTRIGPAWTDRGRPATGYFTKRMAEAWLRDLLAEVRRGTLAGMVRSGATFSDAAAEWVRFIEEDRERKPSTLKDYRSALNAHLLPAFGGPAVGGDHAGRHRALAPLADQPVPREQKRESPSSLSLLP